MTLSASRIGCVRASRLGDASVLAAPMPERRALVTGRAARILGVLGVMYALAMWPRVAAAQDNYEIQVYGSALVPRGRTMVELHSNFTFSGTKGFGDGVDPTYHALHETLEITHGFNEWLEVGFYVFTSARDGAGAQWVGDHVRPRIAVPERWHWPVGLSLSQEIGYQRRRFSQDTWTWEIRPIIDQHIGRWYWSLNPALERALVGENVHQGFEFSPNAQVTYDLTRKVNLALEYYGAFGPVRAFDPFLRTQQTIFPSVNLDFGDDWEFNAGVGPGLTRETDRLLMKMIVGYRFGRDRPVSQH